MWIMQIETLTRNNSGQWESLRQPHMIEAHGWDSPEDYVTHGRKNYAAANPYQNGLEVKGPAGTIQRVTFFKKESAKC